MPEQVAPGTFDCERCGKVTIEEIKKCPQYGCPVRKHSASPLSDPAAREMQFVPESANPYQFSSTAPLEIQTPQPGNMLVYSIIGTYGLGMTIGMIALFTMEVRTRGNQIILAGVMGLAELAVVLFIVPWILLQIWFYRTWSIIPKERGGVNPVLVILLQFIPCFNLYWWYRIMPGLSVAIGNLRREQEPDTDERDGFWFAIAALLAFVVGVYIPPLMILFYVLFAVWLVLVNRAKNRYLEHKLGIRKSNDRIRSSGSWSD